MNRESVCCERVSLAFAFQRLNHASAPFRRRSKKSRKPLFLLVYLPAPQVVSCRPACSKCLEFVVSCRPLSRPTWTLLQR